MGILCGIIIAPSARFLFDRSLGIRSVTPETFGALELHE
jgi:hypothetical protein